MAVGFPVRADLRATLLTVAGLPAVAWEGRAFEPDPEVPYITERLHYLNDIPTTLGNYGHSQMDIAYMLTVHFPARSANLSELEALADALIYAYPLGRRVGSARVHGRVTRSRRGSVMTDAAWRSITVTISCFVHRSTHVEP